VRYLETPRPIDLRLSGGKGANEPRQRVDAAKNTSIGEQVGALSSRVLAKLNYEEIRGAEAPMDFISE